MLVLFWTSGSQGTSKHAGYPPTACITYTCKHTKEESQAHGRIRAARAQGGPKARPQRPKLLGLHPTATLTTTTMPVGECQLALRCSLTNHESERPKGKFYRSDKNLSDQVCSDWQMQRGNRMFAINCGTICRKDYNVCCGHGVGLHAPNWRWSDCRQGL